MRTRDQIRGNKNICGMKIEYLRKEKGIKQVEMLESLALLSKIEGQHRTINDYELAAIANVLDISTDILLGRL